MATQSERTTKEIKMPNDHTATVYSYLTGGELRKVQASLMDGVTAGDLALGSASQNVVAMNKVPASNIFKAQEVALKFILVSLDGCSTEEAYNRAMDLPSEELAILMSEVDEHIASPTADKKKVD